MSCVSITDEVVSGQLDRLAVALIERLRAQAGARRRPGSSPEDRAAQEADALGLRGPLRRDYIEERIAKLRASPWGFSPLLPVAAPSRRSAAAPDVYLDRLARPRLQVTLSHGARQAIEREIRAEAPRGLETGGLLFAFDPPDRDDVQVCCATGPAATSRHTSHSVEIGSIARVEAELPDFLRRQNLECVGTYHTHPGYDGEPSQTDMRSWARMLTRTHSSFVGVIATRDPDGHGWSLPKLHAWHAYRDGARVVVAPALIHEP